MNEAPKHFSPERVKAPNTSDEKVRTRYEERLKLFGADNKSLEGLSLEKKFRTLLPIATLRLPNTREGSDEDFYNEGLRDEAFIRINDLVLNNGYDGAYQLAESLRLDSSVGLRDAEIFDEVISLLHIPEKEGNELAVEARRAIEVVADELENGEFHPQLNYLSCERFAQIIRVETAQERRNLNIERWVPFELTSGSYAVFSEDMDTIFIGDKSDSREIDKILKTLNEALAARKTRDQINEEYPELTAQLFRYGDYTLDGGTPLDSIAKDLGIEDSDLVKDYTTVLRSSIKNIIETDFGVSLKDFSVKEQLFFLNYLKNTTVEQAETMQRFTSLYGVDGIRTFLSLEWGDETLGDQIVAFGQHDEVAGTVFKYYGELLSSAERAEALVKEVSDCEGEACVDLANQVRENIVNRAQKDLEKAVRAHDPSEVLDQIENYVAAAKEYVALLQEVGAGKIEHVNSSELSTDEQDRMKILMKANYDKAYPEPKNEDFKAAVAGSLEKSFSNPDTSFRVLRDDGKIVSYNRFDTIRDFTGKEVSYFGSFNADPAYSGVGGVMLEETIKDQLESGRPMMAHCDPTQAITRKYIEDGFVATGFYELAGKPSFEIWRSKDSSTQLESKGRSIDELLESVGESGTMIVREQSESEMYPELQNSMGLTRYFTHDGKTYLVFETLPDTLKAEFTPPQEEKKEAA